MNDLAKASAAEDFFRALDVSYEQRVVDVYRLHILHRFRRYVADTAGDLQRSEHVLRGCLERAYADFAGPQPAEKSFKVFAATRSFVPLAAIDRGTVGQRETVGAAAALTGRAAAR